MILLLTLLACGFDGELDTPSPPPPPPTTLSAQAADLIVHTGVVSDVSAATRTFASTGEGRRIVCVFSASAVLEIDGHVAQLTDLTDGRTVTVEGKEVGDIVLVSRATVAPLPLDADDAPPAATADGTAPPGTTPSTDAAPNNAAAAQPDAIPKPDTTPKPDAPAKPASP